MEIYCIYTFLYKFLKCVIEIIIKSQPMSFLCNFFQRNTDHVELHIVPTKNTSHLNDPFTSTQSSAFSHHHSFPHAQEQPLSLAYSAPIRRIDSITTIEEPRAPRLNGSNLNPEQPRYYPLNTVKVQKGALVDLLQNKEKLLPQGERVPQDTAIRMVRKSDYQQKVKSNYNGKKWLDQSFVLTPTYQTYEKQIIQIDWPFFSEFSKQLEKPFCFMDSDLNPTDIVQGRVGDCYFLSAVAALIRKTERIPRLFPNCDLNSNGVYMAQLMFKGILQEVVVDERFPVIKGSKQLLGCRSKRQILEIYGMVLEKCWAKLWKSYQQIDGGFPHSALHALTCAPTKNYILLDETATPQDKQKYWRQVLGFSQSGFVMCTGVDQKDNRKLKISTGQVVNLAQDHVYCVEYFFENGSKQKMVRLYNPWGNNGSHINGQIEAEWDQFITNFKYLTVCKVNDRANYLFIQLQNCKQKKFTFVEINVVDPKNGYLAISLSETDRKDAPKHRPYLTVTFFAFKCNTKSANPQYELVAIRTSNQYSDHYFQLYGVASDKYIIGMYFSEVDINQPLTFGVYSQAIFGFKEKELDMKYQQLMLEQGFTKYQLSKEGKERVYPKKEKDVWYSFDMMCGNSSFGYLMLHVGKDESKYSIAMGGKAIDLCGLQMWEPYVANRIVLEGEPGANKVVILTAKRISEYRKNEASCFTKENKHYHSKIKIQKA